MPFLTRLLKYPFQGQFAGEWRWPKGIAEAGWDRVIIPHPSGACLAGILGLAKGKPIGTVLLAHPLGRTAKGFWLKNGHASFYRELGFHVLAFDFNGFGESQDAAIDFPQDVLAVADWLKQTYPHLPCGAVGSSFGAAWILCAIARRRVFDAVLIESTFPRLEDFWRSYPLPNATLKLARILLPRLEPSMRPLLAAKNIKGHIPIILLYSETDPHTPLSDGEELLSALSQKTSAQLVIATSAEHTHIFRDARQTYTRAAYEFTDQMKNAGLEITIEENLL